MFRVLSNLGNGNIRRKFYLFPDVKLILVHEPNYYGREYLGRRSTNYSTLRRKLKV